MESTLWSLRTLDSLLLAGPIALCLVACFGFFNWDFVALPLYALYRRATGRGASDFVPRGAGERPSALVVIPSLLRNRADFTAITTTVESCGDNGYPGQLTIVASVDGPDEAPALYQELRRWIAARRYPGDVRVRLSHTPSRLGKMMAVEAGVDHIRRLVASGALARLPDVYFSIDGDGTLSPNALEILADRLATPHPLTRRLRRVVSGKICIRYDLQWQGWRRLFTVAGQIHNQVAREFLVSNVARYNWKPTPQIGIPGALYCTWFEVIDAAPRYMGFMQSITFRDAWRWWLGFAPPRFSERGGPPMPEALTGASDDTCIAFLASIASWKDGRLDFDAPRTPLHALGRFLLGYFVERSHDYAPEARVFTYTPSTVKGLWTQRVRWNASRVECAGRFWRAFWFHWEIGLPVSLQVVLLLHTVFDVGFYYVLLPYTCFGSSKATVAFLIGYLGQTLAYGLYTVIALALDTDRKKSYTALACLPLASLYCITINMFGCVVGVSKDVFFFGNTTNFAPEWTLSGGQLETVYGCPISSFYGGFVGVDRDPLRDATSAFAVMSPVTLPTVASTSGIASTAISTGSGAIGKPIAWVTGRLVAMKIACPGRPTEPMLTSTDKATPVARWAKVRSMPIAQAMKLALAMYWIGEVMRNSETAIGSTSPETDCGKPSRCCELSSIAGNVAREDCVLAATACTGAMPDRK